MKSFLKSITSTLDSKNSVDISKVEAGVSFVFKLPVSRFIGGMDVRFKEIYALNEDFKIYGRPAKKIVLKEHGKSCGEVYFLIEKNSALEIPINENFGKNIKFRFDAIFKTKDFTIFCEDTSNTLFEILRITNI